MRRSTTFIANIVQIGELGKTAPNEYNPDGKSYLPVTFVRNYVMGTGENREQKGIYERVTLWGFLADDFNNSGLRPGHQVLVSGYYSGRMTKEYTNKKGEVVPPTFVEELQVEAIGVVVSKFNKVDFVSTIGQGVTKQTAPKTKAVADNKPKPVQVEDDLFDDSSDDLFGDTSSDFDELFA